MESKSLIKARRGDNSPFQRRKLELESLQKWQSYRVSDEPVSKGILKKYETVFEVVGNLEDLYRVFNKSRIVLPSLKRVLKRHKQSCTILKG